MAYGLKYYKEFAWTNYANDTTGNTRIEILENNYSGLSVEIDELGETPVQLRLDNTGDMINQTIKKTSLILSIIDTDQFDYSQFYTSDGKKYKVNLISSVANWTGYLVPQSFGQELGTNGLISITASDGLHLLQGIDYVADKNRTLKLADFIADIETKIGLGTFDRSVSLATDKGDLWHQFIYEGMFLDKNYEDCLDMVLTAYGLQVRYWKLFPVTSILSHSFSGSVKCLDNVPMVDYLPIAKKLKINQNLTTLPDILEDAMVDDATDVIERTPAYWRLAKWVTVSDNGLPVYPYKGRQASENMYKSISMYAIPTNAPYDTQRLTGHEGSKYVLREFDSTSFQIEFNANFGRLSVYGRSSETGYQEKLRPISWSQIHWGLYDTKTNKSFSKATNSWSITGRPTYSTANTIRVDNPADSDVTVYINVPKTTGDVLGLELFLFTPSFKYNNPTAEATNGIFSINSIKIAEVGGISENELYNEIKGTITIGDNIDIIEYDYELGTSPSYPTNTSLYYGSSLYNNIYDQITSFTLAGNSVNQMQYLANTILYSNGAGRKSVFSGTFAPMNNGNLMFYMSNVNNVNCLINSFTLDVRRVKFVDAEFIEIAPFAFTNYTITSESSIGSSDWGGSGGSSGAVGGGGGTVDTSNFVVKTGAVTQNIEGSVTVEGAVVAGASTFTGLLTANGGINATTGTFSSYVTAQRFYTGYDSGQANSISCSNWFRSSGSSGWYNDTYGAGILSDTSNVVRTYSTNKFKVYNTEADSITTLGGIKLWNGIKSVTLTVDENGNLKVDGNIYSTGEVSAYGAGTGTGGGAVGSLGGLANVGLWADEVPASDRIMVQLAGATHWSSMLLSEIVGLDTVALSAYLTTNKYTTETYVNTKVAELVGSSPATLDTLNELAAALGNDPNFATSMTTLIGTKWTQDNTKIANWDSAYSALHSHTNKTELDGITSTLITNWNAAYTNNHTHPNKPIIDNLTQANLDVLAKLSIVDGNLKVDANLWSTGEISAYGAGSGTGGGGTGLITSVLGSTGLGGSYLDSDLTNTFNAYTINLINTNLTSALGRIGALETSTPNVAWGTPTSQYSPLTINSVTRNLSVDGHTHSSFLDLELKNIQGGDINHRLELGYSGRDYINWYEYGGLWKFIQRQGAIETELLQINPVNILYKGNAIWHAGNFNPSNYLPLTGGTLSRYLDVDTPASSGSSFIRFLRNGVPVGYVGDGASGANQSINFYNYVSGKGISLGNDGKLRYDGFFVWHEGNDGAGSGLDAGLLCGRSAELFFKTRVGYLGNINDASLMVYNSSCYWAPNTTGNPNNGYGVLLNISDDIGWYNQFGFGTDNKIYFRQSINSVKNFGAWKTVAFEDSNVASATKLANTRTIWGQNFNGEANVTGNLVGSWFAINDVASNPYFKLLENSNAWYLQGYANKLYLGNGTTYSLNIDNVGNATHVGYVTGLRFYTGYDAGIANSFSCSNWFRSSGATGWYNGTYGGGVYMDDATYVKIFNNKSFWVNGNIVGTGEVTAYSASDLRLKTEVVSLTNSLQIIQALNPVSYKWNSIAKELNPLKGNNTDYGLIAQELETVMPELVHSIYDGKYKSIDYVKLIPHLICAIKQLKMEIDNLKKTYY